LVRYKITVSAFFSLNYWIQAGLFYHGYDKAIIWCSLVYSPTIFIENKRITKVELFNSKEARRAIRFICSLSM